MAPICCMSHCRPASGSSPRRGRAPERRRRAARRDGGLEVGLRRVELLDVRRSRRRFGAEPIVRLCAAPSMAGAAAASAAKSPLLLRIGGDADAVFSLTIVPPAAVDRARARPWPTPPSRRTTT